MKLIELHVPVLEDPERAIVEVCQALRHTLHHPMVSAKQGAYRHVFGPQFRASGHHERYAVFRLTDGDPLFPVWEDMDKLPDSIIIWEPKC